MDRQQLMQIAQANPQIGQAVAQIEQQLGSMNLTSADLNEAIQALEYVMDHPDEYQAIRQDAIQRGWIDAQTAPEEFNPAFVIAMLICLYGLQERLGAQGFKRGGLAALASQGRGGDTMLAHINPREAAVLKAMGGSGTINPNTGLPEFKSGIGKVLGVVASVAVPFVAPMVASTLGISSLAAGALTGAGASLLSGGNPLQGALMGGMGAGLGSTIGSGLGLSGTAADVVGSGIAGGLGGAISGQGFGKGALQGALGAGLGSLAGSAGEQMGGAMGAGLKQGGTQFANMMASGFSPSQAALGGLMAGGYGAYSHQPQTGALQQAAGTGLQATGGEGLQSGTRANLTNMGGGQGIAPSAMSQTAAPTQGALSGMGLNLKTLTSAAPLLGLLGSAQTTEQAKSAIASQSPDQRPLEHWDWDRIQQDAARSGMGVGQFVANNWDKVNSGAYVKPQVASQAAQPTQMARGGATPYQRGALSNMGRLMAGGGTGRSDEIPAKLSDGEYVMDAETVALLGDGSTNAGAKKLDRMRHELRSHKGKALAKGKFSPNAKSPLAYLKEAA